MAKPDIRWRLACPETIRQAIARTERYLLRDLPPQDRADETARLDRLRALLRMAR